MRALLHPYQKRYEKHVQDTLVGRHICPIDGEMIHDDYAGPLIYCKWPAFALIPAGWARASSPAVGALPGEQASLNVWVHWPLCDISELFTLHKTKVR